jgi:hypothetical protein
LGLKSKEAWISYSKSGDKPLHIPADPYAVYSNEWEGIADWLGYEDLILLFWMKSIL